MDKIFRTCTESSHKHEVSLQLADTRGRQLHGSYKPLPGEEILIVACPKRAEHLTDTRNAECDS